MLRDDFIEICSSRLKLIRAEYSLTQEKMANIIGISKKTLVEIEKGRSSLGWSASVALCTIFSESQIISDSFGGKPDELIHALAFLGEPPKDIPMQKSRKIWWQTVEELNGCIIEQNIIFQHYRLIAPNNEKIQSSFNIEELENLIPKEASNNE